MMKSDGHQDETPPDTQPTEAEAATAAAAKATNTNSTTFLQATSKPSNDTDHQKASGEDDDVNNCQSNKISNKQSANQTTGGDPPNEDYILEELKRIGKSCQSKHSKPSISAVRANLERLARELRQAEDR